MISNRKLDAALAIWAKANPGQEAGDEKAVQRILRHADQLAFQGSAANQDVHHPWWWFGGLSALAAAILVLTLTATGLHNAGFSAGSKDNSVAMIDAGLNDGPVFVSLFTPMSDEEYQL